MSTSKRFRVRDTVTREAVRLGGNGQRSVSNYLDPDRERLAADSPRHLLGDLDDRTFLDVGCGSGLFSLCAYRGGARWVLSFDVDPASVAATRVLHQRAGSPENWLILQGSILDSEFIQTLERADVVYSWGVVHHTGAMYRAIRNAASLVDPGGLCAMAIYNRISQRWLTSERWWRIKRMYNHAPSLVRRLMEMIYVGYWAQDVLRWNASSVRIDCEHLHRCGTALRTDMIDWLGGYPYEFATADEIIQFCERECGMRCTKLIPVTERDRGYNQFVFEPLRSTSRDRSSS